jgi:hypothetical protein
MTVSRPGPEDGKGADAFLARTPSQLGSQEGHGPDRDLTF